MNRIRIGDIAEVISDRIDNPSESGYERFVGLEHYDSGEVVIRRYGNTDMLISSMKAFREQDTLVARRNVYLRRAAMVDFPGITSGDSIVLRAKRQDDAMILPFILNTESFWDYANQFADGSMSKRLSPKLLLDYETSVPDGEDKTRLSDLLWRFQATRRSYQNLIACFERLVKSQFMEEFGEPNKESAKWETLPFREVTICFDNRRKPVKSGDRKSIQGPYPYYGATGIVDYVNDYRLDGTYLLISEDGKALEFRNYDIAFIASGKIWVNNHAHVVQCNELSTLTFLQYYFKYLDISHWVTGIDQKKLNRENLDSIPIMVPPRDRLLRFDSFVEQLDKSKYVARKVTCLLHCVL